MMDASNLYIKGMEHLIGVVQRLSLARTLDEIVDITRHAARELTGADGATFILRDHDHCYYVDEDAISPLWKGKRFPMSKCISGWTMLNKKPAVIEDIFSDPRIPVDAYRPTFVKSLAMVPIREEQPIGAIGNYWATHRTATSEEVSLLKALADSTSIALENVRLINDLSEAKGSLEESLRSRDEFLSIVSHELRTPLSALKLQLQITDKEIKASGGVAKSNFENSHDLLNRQVVNLTALVEQLLDISRIRLGKLDLDYSRFDLSSAVRKAIEQMIPVLKEARCTMKMELSESILGEWDLLRINQIVTSLVSNACKYARGSTVTVSVRDDGQSSAVLTVSDTGPGIPARMQSRIFERFERGISSDNVSGLGLGLFIVRNVVRAHGGHIRVENNNGGGARLVVELPMRRLGT